MNRLLALFFLILGFLSRASEGYQVFSAGSFQGLRDGSGGVLIPPVYDALGWSNGDKVLVQQVIGYYENGKWGLINSKNKRITSAKYASLIPYDDHYFLAAIKGQFTNHLYHGLMNAEGRVLIDFHYFSIEKWTEDLHVVSEYREGTLWYGACGAEGKLLIPINYQNLRLEGPILVGTHINQSQFLYRISGTPIFNEPIDHLTLTETGYQAIKNGRVGWVSPDGTSQLPLEYKSIKRGTVYPFPTWEIRPLDGTPSRQVACDSLHLNDQGQWIAHFNHVEQLLGGSDLLMDYQKNELKYLGGGFMVVKSLATEKWALHKTDGRLIAGDFDSLAIDSHYFYGKGAKGWDIYTLFGRKLNNWPFEDVGESHDRNIPVKKNGYWGWIDFQGELLVDFKYDQVSPGVDRNSFVSKYIGSWGVNDFTDHFLITPKFDQIRVRGTLYQASKEKSTTIFSASGQEVYRSGAQFSLTGPLTFLEEGKMGLVLLNYRVIAPAYDSIRSLGDHLLAYKSGFITLICADGKVLFGPESQVQHVFSHSEELFHVLKGQQHGFVDDQGRLRIANRYEDASSFSDSLAAIKLRGRWGLIDHDEQLIVQPFYQQIGPFREDHAVVIQKNEFGLIRKDGKEVLLPEWREIKRLPTGNYLLVDNNGSCGFADDQGKILLSPAYTKLTDTHAGLLIVEQAGKMGVLDYKGFTKVPFLYSKIEIKGEYLLLRK